MILVSFEKLNQILGISCVKPQGAFYAFPSIQLPHGITDEQYVLELLEATGVLVVYGSGFAQKPNSNHFRIVFLPDEKILNNSYDLIANFTAEFYKKHDFEPV